MGKGSSREGKKGGKSRKEEKRNKKHSANTSKGSAPATVSKVLASGPTPKGQSKITAGSSRGPDIGKRPWSDLVIVRPGSTTPNQANASARKKHLRQLRLAEEKAEAKRFGITVSELQNRKAQAVIQILADNKKRAEDAARRAVQSPRPNRCRY
jgi:hypothetical protein